MSPSPDVHDRDLVFVGCGHLARCPREWDALATTSMRNERHCGTCDRIVYRCESEAEFQEHARLEHCVAFFPSVFPANEIKPRSLCFVGAVITSYSAGETLSWD